VTPPPGPSSPPPRGSSSDEAGILPVVHQNIASMIAVRRRQDDRRTRADRAADAVTRFAGSVSFVWVHALIFGGWVAVNSLSIKFIHPWDPFPYVMLAVITSVEAIFLSTFILITQNRMARIADSRAELDLQISLLTEHELTRVIQILDSVARKLGAALPPEPELAEIKKDIDAEKVVQEIETAQESVK